MNYRLTNHARAEMVRRNIPIDLIETVLDNPQQILADRETRKVYQSRIDFGAGRVYLLRLIVRDDIDPILIITVYRTRKIAKYWREP